MDKVVNVLILLVHILFWLFFFLKRLVFAKILGFVDFGIINININIAQQSA
jgi:hypothetical protein